MNDLSYAEYRAALLGLFATVDPGGLVNIGAPRDEYEPQVDDLVKWQSPVTAEQVKDTFIRWFGQPTGDL